VSPPGPTESPPTGAPRALLLSGASGMVGAALAERRPVLPLPRRDPGTGAPWWEPAAGRVHDGGRAIGAVVHLAGAPVAERRWTAAVKAKILASRREGSRALVAWLAALPPERRPTVLVSASAIGIYGDRGDEELTEQSSPGSGFLAETCQTWEDEVRRAEDLGLRTVRVRIGIALSPRGGALGRMLPIFRLGGGGPMGSGRQWFPWVHLDDLVSVLLHAVDTPSVTGAVNAVAPGIVRQADFARALGRAMGRPTLLPTPALALKLVMGAELAQEALLASARVLPTALLADPGFRFRFPTLDDALADLLKQR